MEKKKEISLTKITAKIIPMMFHYCPLLAILLLTLGIMHGVSFGVNTFVTQKFFDEVNKTVSGNGTINSNNYAGIYIRPCYYYFSNIKWCS